MALIKKIGEKDENRISIISGSRVDRRIPDRHLRNNNLEPWDRPIERRN